MLGAEKGTEIATRLLLAEFQNELLASKAQNTRPASTETIRARPLNLDAKQNRPTTPDLQQLQDLLTQFGRHADLLVRDLRNQLKDQPELRTLMADAIANQVRGSVLSSWCASSPNLDAIRPNCRSLDYEWRAIAQRLQEVNAPESVQGSARAIDRELAKVRALLDVEISIDRERLSDQLRTTTEELQDLRERIRQILAHEVSVSDWEQQIAWLAASTHVASEFSETWEPPRLQEAVVALWKEFTELRLEWRDKSTFQLDAAIENVRSSFREALRLVDRDPWVESDELPAAIARFQNSLTPVRGNLATGKLVTIPQKSRDELLTEIDQLSEECRSLLNDFATEKSGKPSEIRSRVNQLSLSWRLVASKLKPLRARIYVDSQSRLEFYEGQIRALAGLHNISESTFLTEVATEIRAHASALELNDLAKASQELAELASESESSDSSTIRAQVERAIRSSQPILDAPGNAISSSLRRKIAILSAGWYP